MLQKTRCKELERASKKHKKNSLFTWLNYTVFVLFWT